MTGSVFSGWIVKGFYYSVLVNTLCKVFSIVPYYLFSWHFGIFISVERIFLFLVVIFSFFLSAYNAFRKYMGRSVLDLLIVFCLFFLPLFETYKCIVPLAHFDLFEYMAASWLQLHQKSSALCKVDLIFTLIQVCVVWGVVSNLRNVGVVTSDGISFWFVPSEFKSSIVRGGVRVFCILWMVLLVTLFSTIFFVSAFLGGITNNTLEIQNTSSLTSIMRTYQKEVFPGKVQKIVLVPMVHVGESQFYKGIIDYLGEVSHPWIFLEEGIQDKDKIFGLEIQRGYNSLANKVHLEEQGRNFPTLIQSRNYKVVNGDVSATQFSQETKDILRNIFEMMAESTNILGFFRHSQKVKIEDPQIRAMGKDILHLRNEKLLAVLDRELKKSSFFVIPWGAAHIPAFQEHLSQAGFAVIAERSIRVMDFSQVILRYFGLM